VSQNLPAPPTVVRHQSEHNVRTNVQMQDPDSGTKPPYMSPERVKSDGSEQVADLRPEAADLLRCAHQVQAV